MYVSCFSLPCTRRPCARRGAPAFPHRLCTLRILCAPCSGVFPPPSLAPSLPDCILPCPGSRLVTTLYRLLVYFRVVAMWVFIAVHDVGSSQNEREPGCERWSHGSKRKERPGCIASPTRPKQWRPCVRTILTRNDTDPFYCFSLLARLTHYILTTAASTPS